MSINNSENIVKKRLEKEGYDLIKSTIKGHPDFRVFHKDKKEFFLLEIKTKPISFTKNQKIVFQEILDPIYLAILDENKIIFSNFKTKEQLFILDIDIPQKLKPNISCNKCNYKWFTTSKAHFVSCPNCLAKIKVNFNYISHDK